MEVTKHAIDRYLEREDNAARLAILDIIHNGEKVYPIDKQKSAILLMNNGYNDADYYYYKGLVAVVVKDRIVTVFKRVKKAFTDKITV